MREKLGKVLEGIILTVNFLAISYALSMMELLFRSHPVFILFFASEIWLLTWHYEKLKGLLRSTPAALAAEGIAVVLLLLIVRQTGYLDGALTPWQ